MEIRDARSSLHQHHRRARHRSGAFCPSFSPENHRCPAAHARCFAPFGEVIESGLDAPLSINGGMTERFHDLARVDLGPGSDSRALISIFETQPYALPLKVGMLERHPLGSQAFIPMDGSAFLVVVAPAGDTVDMAGIRAFVTNGRQGVNYSAGVWHHPLAVTGQPASFLVVDRGGPGPNCDEQHFAEKDVVGVVLPPSQAVQGAR